MTEYFTFRTRVGHDPIPFEEDSVILTEKTALNLELSVGDTFYVEAADGSRVPLVLTGITENYMFTRLYLSGAQLESLLGGTPEWNTVYGLTGCTTEAEYNALRTKLLGCNYVSSVSFTEDTTSMFGSLIGSLNYVVLIIVCAAALAAVVLYNLISVNLAERKKELAPSRCWASMTKKCTATSSARSSFCPSSAPAWACCWACRCTGSSS